MSLGHMGVLYGLLVLLGVSLLAPGLSGMLRVNIGRTWLVADAVDARCHLRGLNAMMAAIGALALWAVWDLERSRMLVMGLGLVMLAVAISRLYSILVDGPPDAMGASYLGIEAVLGGVFLFWPPPLA
jgi:uncharacterized protein DUF4345